MFLLKLSCIVFNAFYVMFYNIFDVFYMDGKSINMYIASLLIFETNHRNYARNSFWANILVWFL